LLKSIMYHARVLFFFSSRRRHTRSKRDWSSDVCSSDLESVKSYNTRFKKKKWQKNPKYKANSMRYNLRSMNLRGDLLTFSTVNKRQRHLISIPTFFKEKYPDRKLQAGRIVIDKNNQPYALLTFTIPDQNLKSDGKIIGLDRGVRNIVSTSEGVNYSSSKLRANRRKSLYNRSQLQSKGTRSARRKLREQAGREKRYSAQVNHVISKELANDSSVQTYVLEDLSNLAKKAKSKWMKRSNKRLCDWTHGQLLSFLEYKCEANGISLELVDPKYTSQDCSRCKFRSQSARNGGQYKCSRCGLVIHADENAALNIRDRYLEKLST